MRIRARLSEASAGRLAEFVVDVTGRVRPAAVPVRSARPSPATRRAVRRASIDLSIGTPCDPPSETVVARSGVLGDRTRLSAEHRLAGAARRPSAPGSAAASPSTLPADQVAAAIGTKEFVGTLPQWMRLRRPDRDTVLYPAVSYPTYAMGATLAGCRPVAVPADDAGRLDLGAVADDDAGRALLLWTNSPSNPTGPSRRPGRRRSLGPEPRRAGVQRRVLHRVHLVGRRRRRSCSTASSGVVAVHSLSKRSNLAGVRVGFYAGDADLVTLPRRGAQARRDDGARTGAGRGGAPRSTTTTAGGRPARALPATARPAWRRRCRPGRESTSRCPTAVSTSGSTSATRGRSPSDWQPKAVRW